MAGGEQIRPDETSVGCGVQGCLTAAVALFVILFLWLIFIMLIRFSEPPQPRFGAAATAAPAVSLTLTGRDLHDV